MSQIFKQLQFQNTENMEKYKNHVTIGAKLCSIWGIFPSHFSIKAVLWMSEHIVVLAPLVPVLVLSQIHQLSMPKSSWPFNTCAILNSLLLSRRPAPSRNNVLQLLLARTLPFVWVHTFWCYCCIFCLWLLLMTPFFLPLPSNLINIATVEAAKAKGMHGCVAQMSCLCFVCVLFTL